jgi:uncharacterized membrane protein YvlD (DUF360 family)
MPHNCDAFRINPLFGEKINVGHDILIMADNLMLGGNKFMAYQTHMTHTGYTDQDHVDDDHPKSMTFLRWLGRFAIIAVILAVVSFLTPGFSITGFWSYIIAAVVISLLDYLVEAVMKVDASPFGKGLKGFLLSAVILYVAQFIVPGMSVTIIGALLGALAIGILDAIFPTRVM